MKLLPALAAALTATAVAAQVPPPPVPIPPELKRPVDGYDMQAPYQRWRDFVERRKGPVIEALIGEPETIDGLRSTARLMRFSMYADFGKYVAGEVRSYCRMEGYREVRGSCRYVLRRAYVPHDAGSYGDGNPVSEWTKSHFDAKSLARHFRAAGLGPDTDWWSTDIERMFAKAPSPDAVLRENATIVRVDSAECPALARAIEALEDRPLQLSVDLPGVGQDTPVSAPRPHATRWFGTFVLSLHKGNVELHGLDGVVGRLADPILDAAAACDKARPKS